MTKELQDAVRAKGHNPEDPTVQGAYEALCDVMVELEVCTTDPADLAACVDAIVRRIPAYLRMA